MRKTLLVGFFSTVLFGCALLTPKPTFLTDKDKVYVVPGNTQVKVIWEEKEQVITTDEAMILLYKGTYLRLEKEANANLIR